MTEKSIVDSIRRYLKGIGAKTEKQHGTMYGRNGVPDILGCYQGRCLALEVKCPGKNVTALQEHELKEWQRAGAIAGRVESVKQVKDLIQKNSQEI